MSYFLEVPAVNIHIYFCNKTFESSLCTTETINSLRKTGGRSFKQAREAVWRFKEPNGLKRKSTNSPTILSEEEVH